MKQLDSDVSSPGNFLNHQLNTDSTIFESVVINMLKRYFCPGLGVSRSCKSKGTFESRIGGTRAPIL